MSDTFDGVMKLRCKFSLISYFVSAIIILCYHTCCFPASVLMKCLKFVCVSLFMYVCVRSVVVKTILVRTLKAQSSNHKY